MSDQFSKFVIAIDPGISGAFSVMCLKNQTHIVALDVQDIPTVSIKNSSGATKSHINLNALAKTLAHYKEYAAADIHTIIEEVNAMPGQGVTSMFRFGYAAGSIAGVVACLDLPNTFVRPQAWQPIAGVRGKSGDDAGRLRAVQLFPALSDKLSRKKDHNRADALLLGYAALRGKLF